MKTCYTHDGELKAKKALFKALEWYFADDYFFGTDEMIVWWGKTYKDIKVACESKPAKKVSKKIRDQLDAIRATEGYWETILPKFLSDGNALAQINAFFDGFDTQVAGDKNYFTIGKDCGRVLRDVFELTIEESDC